MGTLIVGKRYRILDEIGKGGMGTVYRAVDSHNHQTVAIKQLKTDSATPALIERFRREGEALRQLNHPNIVKMLDAVEEHGNHYLVMEYVSGGDLLTLLRQEGALPIERTLRIALDMADALTRAHRLDIIHRDLKPANILIAVDGTPRLTDFGVAHVVSKERVTETGAAVGTVHYLAPEAIEGEPPDARTDIWAFGVMLFEMLTDKHPFARDSMGAMLGAILMSEAHDLEALRPDCPVALVDLIYRMLEKQRSARIRSVRLIGLELEDIIHGRTEHTTPKTRFETPPSASAQRAKHNLPAQTTPFVGREAELSELSGLLDNSQVRLITILAPGGMGKTRLGLELAGQHLERFDNGVYFVELAPLGSIDDQLISTIQRLIEMLRGGYSILQCFEFLGENAPEPTAGASRGFVADLKSGSNPPEAMQKFSIRARSRYVSRLVDVMHKQFGEGGNLADRLDELTEVLRRELGETRWSNKVEYAEGLIIPAIAQATGYQFQDNKRNQKQQILDFLREKQMLLVMDNYEHLLDGAGIVGEILKVAPQVKVVATSRQRLSQTGETLFHLSGMAFPEWETPEDALAYAAVTLFMNSARRVRPDFELTEDNLNYVARICRLVAGMPLGIVLAGSWLAVLSPQEVAEELQRGIDILETDETELPERQRSIRAVFDRSWEIMTADEQTVFMKLSIFRGGFTRESAEAVAGASLRGLMSLVNKSLIRRDNTSGRYEIHELLRQYSEERLRLAGDLVSVKTKHAHYYASFLAEREVDLKGRRQILACEEIDTNIDNLRVAWNYACEARDFETIGRMDYPFMIYDSIRNNFDAEDARLKQAYDRLSPQSNEAPHDVWNRIRLRDMINHRRLDIDVINEALAVAVRNNDLMGQAYYFLAHGVVLRDQQDYPATIEALGQSITLLRRVDDTFMLVRVLIWMGRIYTLLGDNTRNLELKQEAITICNAQTDHYNTARTLANLATDKIGAGDYAEAETFLSTAIELFRVFRSQHSLVANQCFLGLIHFARGDFEKTLGILEEAHQIAQETGIADSFAFLLCLRGYIACLYDDYDLGINYLQSAQRRVNDTWDMWVATDIDWGFSIGACGTNDMPSARHHNVRTLRFGVQTQSSQFLYWGIPISAVILFHEGQYDYATQLLGLISQFPKHMIGWSKKWTVLIEVTQQLKDEMGEQAYQQAFAHGESLDFETVVQGLLEEFGGDE